MNDETTTRLVNELKQLSNEPTIKLKTSPSTIFHIICQLQLALRHPQNTGTPAQQTRQFAETLVNTIPFPDSIKELISMGWNPEHDVVVEPKVEREITEVVEVHNVATIYGLNSDGSPAEEPIAMMSRPQDWGNKDRWHYEFFKLEWTHQNKHYVNNFHGWTDIKDPKNGYPELFAGLITMILMPGKPPQLCGQEYLGEDDFWSESWGEMPPYYDPWDNDDLEDEDIYE
ncbi:hypothetical protein NIES4103_22000 [Nostoc sp. NIES-4103]|nr:hypothetical protein NIES4103_22000 [Nostoc sp. NIES-4103]